VGRPSLKSQDDTTPQELTKDSPCCKNTRFIDRNQCTGVISHAEAEEFGPEWLGEEVFKGRNHNPMGKGECHLKMSRIPVKNHKEKLPVSQDCSLRF